MLLRSRLILKSACDAENCTKPDYYALVRFIHAVICRGREISLCGVFILAQLCYSPHAESTTDLKGNAEYGDIKISLRSPETFCFPRYNNLSWQQVIYHPFVV